MNKNAIEVSRHWPHVFSEQRPARPSKAIGRKWKSYLKAEFPNRMREDAVEVETHPVLDLLEKPNPILDRCGLMWLTTMYLQATGSAFWYISKGELMGTPSEIWPLPAQFTFPILGKDSIFERYEFRLQGLVADFTPEEIIHFRIPSPIDTISAFGDLKGGLLAVETNIRMIEYERALFENMAMPDVLLSPKGDTTAAQLQGQLVDFENEFRGWKKVGKTAVFPQEVEVTKLGFTQRELQFPQGREWIRKEIANGFGVPTTILDTDSATFSNLDKGIMLWGRNTILPKLTHIGETLTCQLMPMYARDSDGKTPWFIAFDNPVPEDTEAIVAKETQLVASNIHTINQAQVELGDEGDTEWGDEPWMPTGLVQPSGIAEQVEFDRALTQQAATDAAAALEPEATEPLADVSVAELTNALAQFVDRNDVDGANMIREVLAQRLGRDTLPPLTEIKPSSSVGIVEPDQAANAEELMQPAVQPGVKPGGQDEQPQAEAKETEDGKGKSRDKAATSWCEFELDEMSRLEWKDSAGYLEAFPVLYDKLPLDMMDPGGQDSTLSMILRDFFAEMSAVTRTKLPQVVEGLVTLQAVFESTHWIKELAKRSNGPILAQFRRGATIGGMEAQRLGIEVGQLTGQQMAAEVRKLSKTFASTVVNLTGDQLEKALVSAIDAGEGIEGATKRINEVFNQKEKKQSKLIARTEMGNAANAGAAKTWTEAGITEHIWKAPQLPCQFCAALDGKRVKIGESFVAKGSTLRGVDGDNFRADFKNVLWPTLHPNCRCTIEPVV